MKRKGGGASKGYKSISEMITNFGMKPKKVKLKKSKKKKVPQKPTYKIPKTPKVSGRGWK